MRLVKIVGTSYLAVAALGLVPGGQALAAPDEDVVIIQSAGQIGPRAGDQIVSLTRRVSYADLDLTTPSGAKQLELRVQEVAHTVCEELERRSPSSPNSEERLTCVKGAVADGMGHARAAIAAAGKRTHTAAVATK
jgi:UrcA family protein